MIDTLFTVAVFELFMGGGGRLTEIGPATLRMFLFATCLCASLCLVLIRRPAAGELLALMLTTLYLIVHLPGLIIGTLHGALPTDMFSEMQQSLYFLAAPFFAWVLRSPAMVERTAGLAVLAGVLLSAIYVVTVLGLATGLIDFTVLYPITRETGEIFFRGEGFFFYKGFLYLGIAAVVLIATQRRFWIPLLALVVAAIVLTLTRGFVLSASIAILLMLAAQRRWRWLGLALVAVAATAFMVWVYFPSLDDAALSGQRDISNTQRFDDIDFMLNHVSVGTVLWGEGFGSMINDRLNIENTFLWVFWKLGIAGLVFWCIPFALCLHFFLRIPRGGRRFELACAYFFGTVLVYVQTQTNPYLNNPIGLSFVLIAIFALRTLAQPDPSPSWRTRQPRRHVRHDVGSSA